MPSATHMSAVTTVTARSLLLPPVCVPLRALQWFCRPRCATLPSQCLAQRRPLHLYKTARARTVLGMHKVLTFSPYKLTPRSESKQLVNLVQGTKVPPVTVAEGLTLQELYDKHVKPGQMLYYVHTLPRTVARNIEKLQSDDIPEVSRNYALIDAHSSFANVAKGKKSEYFNSLKVIPLELATPVSHFKITLDRMYQFIELGCPIEVRIRLRGQKLTKEARLEPGDPTTWPWLHNHFPHIRPDFLLRGMPEGTEFLIEPWSDGRHVQWVMCRKVLGMPQVKLERRLTDVRQAVRKSIEQGRQSQLPAVMRQRLRERGLDSYSEKSGLPQPMAQERFMDGHEDAKPWDYEGGETSPSETPSDDRYLVPRRKPKVKYGLKGVHGKQLKQKPKWEERGRR